MTREERQYFYNKLVQLFNNWANEHINDSVTINSKMIESFVDRYMTTITGQQLLPQDVFRVFLNELSPMIANLEQSAGGGTMEESFTTNMAIGGIASGTTIEANTKISEVLRNMLLKFKGAIVKSEPYATISPTGGDVEYGTTISNTSFTATLEDGKFTQYTNGGTSTEEISMRCSKTSTDFKKKVGSGSYADYTNGTSFKVNETTSIKAIVSHSASTAKPTNSDGSSTLSYPIGNKEATATYTPRFGWFFVTLDAMPESVTRETFSNYGGLVTGAFNTTQSFDNKVVLLAIPGAYKLSSALSANNEEQSYTEISIKIADAGGTERSYTLYAFEYAAALGVNVTLKITA